MSESIIQMIDKYLIDCRAYMEEAVSTRDSGNGTAAGSFNGQAYDFAVDAYEDAVRELSHFSGEALRDRITGLKVSDYEKLHRRMNSELDETHRRLIIIKKGAEGIPIFIQGAVA